MPPPSRTDTRFAAIDDAVTLLRMLPPVDDIAWPTEPGDNDTVTDGLRWLAEWAPAAKAAHRRHLAAQRTAARAARAARQPLAARQTLRAD